MTAVISNTALECENGLDRDSVLDLIMASAKLPLAYAQVQAICSDDKRSVQMTWRRRAVARLGAAKGAGDRSLAPSRRQRCAFADWLMALSGEGYFRGRLMCTANAATEKSASNCRKTNHKLAAASL
jgi:hypothetical protein